MWCVIAHDLSIQSFLLKTAWLTHYLLETAKMLQGWPGVHDKANNLQYKSELCVAHEWLGAGSSGFALSTPRVIFCQNADTSAPIHSIITAFGIKINCVG
jgi:hypothetical protein